MNQFRLLRADEIDCRISTVSEKGVSVLLYKDARCDMNILDETVGPLNWQKSYSRENANCTVSIWDAGKGIWISKEDTGTESFTEKEKGLASDSFKRACFNWGIGRELYTAPFIWIGKDLCKIIPKEGGKGFTCYDRFEVKDIGYDENQRICYLLIYNAKTHNKVYEWGKQPKSVNTAQYSEMVKTLQNWGIDTAYVLESLGKNSLQEITGAEYAMINNNLEIIQERCEAWRQKQAS